MLGGGVWEITDEVVSAFVTRSNRDFSFIYLNIEAEYKRIIDDCKNPLETWKRMKNNFQPDTRTHHITVFTELMESRIRHGESLNIFATRLKKIFLNVQQIDKHFAEDYLCY